MSTTQESPSHSHRLEILFQSPHHVVGIESNLTPNEYESMFFPYRSIGDIRVFMGDICTVDDAYKVKQALLLKPLSEAYTTICMAYSEIHYAAQNALLKYLEEPPKNTKIFIFTHLEQLLPTVRSRIIVHSDMFESKATKTWEKTTLKKELQYIEKIESKDDAHKYVDSLIEHVRTRNNHMILKTLLEMKVLLTKNLVSKKHCLTVCSLAMYDKQK